MRRLNEQELIMVNGGGAGQCFVGTMAGITGGAFVGAERIGTLGGQHFGPQGMLLGASVGFVGGGIAGGFIGARVSCFD